MHNKKGVSIMIGYILLVTFAIVISVVVFQWLRTYVPTEGLECPDGVALHILESSVDNNQLTLTLRNNGNFNIDGAFIYYSDNPSQEIATKSFDIIGGAASVGAGFVFTPSELKPTEDNSIVFDITGIEDIYLIEITPTRQQEDESRMQTVSCTDAKTKKVFDPPIGEEIALPPLGNIGFN